MSDFEQSIAFNAQLHALAREERQERMERALAATHVRLPKATFSDLLVERDQLRTKLATARADIERVMDLVTDAESSGRSTVLIENVRRALRQLDKGVA